MRQVTFVDVMSWLLITIVLLAVLLILLYVIYKYYCKKIVIHRVKPENIKYPPPPHPSPHIKGLPNNYPEVIVEEIELTLHKD